MVKLPNAFPLPKYKTLTFKEPVKPFEPAISPAAQERVNVEGMGAATQRLILDQLSAHILEELKPSLGVASTEDSRADMSRRVRDTVDAWKKAYSNIERLQSTDFSAYLTHQLRTEYTKRDDSLDYGTVSISYSPAMQLLGTGEAELSVPVISRVRMPNVPAPYTSLNSIDSTSDTPWRDAVIDQCISAGVPFDENDPVKALHDLITWHIKTEQAIGDLIDDSAFSDKAPNDA